MTDTTTPRIEPVRRAQADALQSELFETLGPGEPLHLFGTLAHHPKLLRDWLRFGGRLLMGGRLENRDRELVILRTSARCASDYEWGQHVGIARTAGLSDEAILQCSRDDPGAPLLQGDLELLAATDEIIDSHSLSDTAWHEMSQRFDDAAMIELLMLVGEYVMLAGLLNAALVQTEQPLPRVGAVS